MKKYKPTTPSRRGMTGIEYRLFLTPNTKPLKAKLLRLKTHAGRNNRGVITTRHQSGGVKKLYRVVDFARSKMNVPAIVEAIEYDPYRSGFLARIIYADGERTYVLAQKGLEVGQTIITSETAPLTIGNRLPLKSIPVGTQVSDVENRPGSGGKFARSAGSSVEILSHEGTYAIIRLASKETRKVPVMSLATIGQMSNPDYSLVNLGKAGRSRWLGIRPTVRGTAMNPVDHPYGGGEGVQPRGTKRPKTMWGKVTGGRKTRNKKKWSRNLILQRRPKRKGK
ncbi:MAG: 50S ribosomal protein L2 [Patescibacteria group bacterium]|mgnify:CR=1 FL=1